MADEETVALVTLSVTEPGDGSVLYRTWCVTPEAVAEIAEFLPGEPAWSNIVPVEHLGEANDFMERRSLRINNDEFGA